MTKQTFTNLEKWVMGILAEPNGNGEMIDNHFGDYLCLYGFGIDNKVLRGVLSSLVKKRYYRTRYRNC